MKRVERERLARTLDKVDGAATGFGSAKVKESIAAEEAIDELISVVRGLVNQGGEAPRAPWAGDSGDRDASRRRAG